MGDGGATRDALDPAKCTARRRRVVADAQGKSDAIHSKPRTRRCETLGGSKDFGGVAPAAKSRSQSNATATEEGRWRRTGGWRVPGLGRQGGYKWGAFMGKGQQAARVTGETSAFKVHLRPKTQYRRDSSVACTARSSPQIVQTLYYLPPTTCWAP